LNGKQQIRQILMVDFGYRFVRNAIKNYTRKEQKLSEIFTYIAFLTIFIACLGLLGLSAFHAERKTKEIGIRKVVGGSISDIVLLLTKEFVKWVLAANVVSWPIAYLIVKAWLRDYAYRINIGLEIFIVSAVLVFSIAVLTVSYQAIKAGKANPVDSLRYE
jgi:putative ABC transport system permease protein